MRRRKPFSALRRAAGRGRKTPALRFAGKATRPRRRSLAPCRQNAAAASRKSSPPRVRRAAQTPGPRRRRGDAQRPASHAAIQVQGVQGGEWDCARVGQPIIHPLAHARTSRRSVVFPGGDCPAMRVETTPSVRLIAPHTIVAKQRTRKSNSYIDERTLTPRVVIARMSLARSDFGKNLAAAPCVLLPRTPKAPLVLVTIRRRPSA